MFAVIAGTTPVSALLDSLSYPPAPGAAESTTITAPKSPTRIAGWKTSIPHRRSRGSPPRVAIDHRRGGGHVCICFEGIRHSELTSNEDIAINELYLSGRFATAVAAIAAGISAMAAAPDPALTTAVATRPHFQFRCTRSGSPSGGGADILRDRTQDDRGRAVARRRLLDRYPRAVSRQGRHLLRGATRAGQ